MRKRRVIILTAACIAVLGGMIWWAKSAGPPDPIYAGHRLSYWVETEVNTDGSKMPEIDSNAVPYLVQELKARDGKLFMLSLRSWTHLPEWLQLRVPIPISTSEKKQSACLLLGRLGISARPAIPELIRLVQEGGDFLKISSATALGKVATSNDTAAVEALIVEATADEDKSVTKAASDALLRINPEAATKAGVTNPAAGTPPL